MNEFSWIEYLRKKMPHSSRVLVGIGDDAAVLNAGKGKGLVISTDVIVENVDFVIRPSSKSLSLRPCGCLATARRKGSNLSDRHAPSELAMTALSPEKIGRKALAVNLSDIAAMGASPTAFVISIGKPSYITASWLKRFYKGLLALARQYDVACVGGDFSRSKEFFASVTIFGEALPRQMVKRSGAKPGDWIAVTGTLGGSLLRHHHDFTPRVREGLFLAKHIKPTAMIDISDGLIQDLSHILKASGVGAVLDLDKIPVSRNANKISRGKETKALASALSGGEDFELLFTVPFRRKRRLAKTWQKWFPKVSLKWIGKIEGKAPQIIWRRGRKKVSPPRLIRKGFSHF